MKPLKLEALQMVYADDVDVTDVYIEPPDAGELTDEDSGQEDEGGLADNLNRNQLNSNAEVYVRTNQDEIIGAELNELEKIDYANIVWTKGDLETNTIHFPTPNYEHLKTLTSSEIFENFFDEDLITFLVTESNKYAQYKNCPNPEITNSEMKCALAILILSGYNILPGKHAYWNSDGDMGNKMVIEAMRRDRFVTICRFIHCADNNFIDRTDKFHKIRPFADKIRKKFMEYYVPENDLNYDESMVKYFGKHSCKQFIRGKPIRFGYKIWSLNTQSGYLVNFSLYQGNDAQIKREYQNVFGKATAPLIKLLDDLPEVKKKLRYNIFFDNLFTSFHLLHYLKEQGYGATGTIREGRIPNNSPLLSKNVMKTKSRGEYVSVLDKTHGIILTRWMDNNVVSIASTNYGNYPLGTVQRFSQKEKRVLQITRPNLIGRYNSSMGGTDLMDENISRWRISLRGKKWWWSLFTWLVDVTVQNAWILHKKAGHKMTQLQFRREIVKTYLTKYKSAPKKVGGRPSTNRSSRSFNRVSDNVRYDNFGHFLTQVDKKIRCNGDNCKSIMRTKCIKCNVGVCIKCNVPYHTQM